MVGGASDVPPAWVWDVRRIRTAPTSACDPHQRGPNQNTTRTERKILDGGLTANCIQLARLQDRSTANQEKALHNMPRRSRRKSHHRRGTKIRDQVFRVPAE